jgi:hypothetical protein
MKSMAFAVALMLLIFAFPVQAQTMTAAQKAEIEKAVKNQITQMLVVWDTLNLEASMQFWSRDKIIGELRPTGLVTNLDTMLATWKKDSANRKTQKIDIQDAKLQIISPDMVIATSIGYLRIELKNGNINNYNYANTTIWVKESGGWKMAFLAEKTAARQ